MKERRKLDYKYAKEFGTCQFDSTKCWSESLKDTAKEYERLRVIRDERIF